MNDKPQEPEKRDIAEQHPGLVRFMRLGGTRLSDIGAKPTIGLGRPAPRKGDRT